jgi:DNA-binding CsgD family transcriptional regulator
MIGRESELRRLARLASAREPAVAIIAGEPGIGKTRLVHELLATLPPATVVLVGQAEPGSLSRPYEVLLDAIDGRPEVDEEQLAALEDPRRSPVERLHTGLALLADLIGDSPAVIVFEDLHWADSESAALFERIADQHGPRLLIGTYRPDEVTTRQPVAGLLARMERRHTVTHVRLDRLTPAQTAAMLAAATGAPASLRAATALHHRTGGNPFFLEELLRALPGYDAETLVEQPLPWSLADVLRGQVEDLEPVSHRVVEAAAVLGHRIPFDLLADVTGTGEDELIAVLRDLVSRGVLAESGEDEFAFRHALVREAIADQMLARQRRRLHEAALDVLLRKGSTVGPVKADPAMVAHHARGAGRYDDMIDAARRGTALYLSIGSAYQALQLAEMGLDEVPDDTELLAGAARAAWLAGLLDDALRYGRRWRDRAGTTTDRAESLYLLVRVAWESRLWDEMRALTEDIETLIAQLPPGADQARAMTAIAQSEYLRDDLDAALVWADRALALADKFDLPGIRLAALLEKGATLTEQPRTAAQGREILSALVTEAEKAGEWVLAAHALNYLVQGVPPSSPDEHAATLERMRVDAERAGFESLAVATYYQGRARLAVRAGDLRTAIATLEDGREQDRGLRRRGRWADYHAVFLAGLYLEAGELDRVEQVIADLATLPNNPPNTIPGLAFHLACRRGDLPRAGAAMDDLLAALAQQGWRSGEQAHDLISAALDVGLPGDRLERLAAALLDDKVWSVWDAFRTLVDAQLAEAHGRHAEALAGYRSIAEAHILGPAIRGTVRVGAARCLLAADRREEAAAEIEAAAPLLAEWRGWRVAQLGRVRARLGLAPVDAPPAVTGPAALTPREREVAVLIGDGLTNAELARRLYISPKTAAVHVSNILRKLGVASRTEVADLIGRSGRPG